MLSDNHKSKFNTNHLKSPLHKFHTLRWVHLYMRSWGKKIAYCEQNALLQINKRTLKITNHIQEP